MRHCLKVTIHILPKILVNARTVAAIFTQVLDEEMSQLRDSFCKRERVRRSNGHVTGKAWYGELAIQCLLKIWLQFREYGTVVFEYQFLILNSPISILLTQISFINHQFSIFQRHCSDLTQNPTFSDNL